MVYDMSFSLLCLVLRVRSQEFGDNCKEVPPVPIPNTVVKLLSVEDTWWATAWENRSSPEQKTTDFFSGLFCILKTAFIGITCEDGTNKMRQKLI